MRYPTLSRFFSNLPVLIILLLPLTGCYDHNKKAERAKCENMDTLKFSQNGKIINIPMDKKLDSLNTLLEAAENDTMRLRILNEMLNSQVDDKKATPFIEKMELIAQ